jgi:hypothetical protein
MLRMLQLQGIDEWLTVELGLRATAVGWSPATLIRRLQRGIVQSSARGASLRSVEANPKVGRGGGWLVWPVYGGRGLRGHWHGVLWANAGELGLGLGQGRTAVYGRYRGGHYSHRRGRGHGVGTARGYARVWAPRACSSVARARRTSGRVHLPKFLRMQRSQPCESRQRSCARFLPGT